MDIKKFRELPLMGIIRGLPLDKAASFADCIVSSGLRTLEVTMNTEKAGEVLKIIKKTAGKNLMLGAGTVLGADELKEALDSGAEFIVMPTLVKEVAGLCVKQGVTVFPGALTPQEIHQAWLAGAAMVKVFPAKFFGPSYFKEIKGPFNDIELLACGGVNAGNIKEFFSSGASGAAFGGSIFRKELIESGGFETIGNSVKELIAAYRA
ncbi:MAG: 2-dehydro-3-deoxyphosphogluconate aldolase [Elusimicrobia bacterium HGW-Elusimicrobia-2]|nr:MAG: 2-dehydro-3-deoxyphosphogluconate aldolase [Elusimicrobia bacterium HGW-Elusimicrobia-2]